MTIASIPHGSIYRSLVVLVVSCAAFIASGAASAQVTKFVTVTCSGGGQLCNNIATFSKTIPNGGVGEGQFTPGPLTCSNFRVHFLVDGTEVAVTGFVGPGQSTGFVSLGFISAGPHTFGVQAEGQVGGCNAGTLGSWAGTVRLMKAP